MDGKFAADGQQSYSHFCNGHAKSRREKMNQNILKLLEYF